MYLEGDANQILLMDVFMVSHFKYDTLSEKFVGYRAVKELCLQTYQQFLYRYRYTHPILIFIITVQKAIQNKRIIEITKNAGFLSYLTRIVGIKSCRVQNVK